MNDGQQGAPLTDDELDWADNYDWSEVTVKGSLVDLDDDIEEDPEFAWDEETQVDAQDWEEIY
tara:strand:- start:70 stop:258 length:189 start_codon:yes stop_codon:yes gene_type:complete